MRYEQIADPAYWASLHPKPAALPDGTLDIPDFVERVRSEGWAQAAPMVPVDALREGVDAVVRAGWLPVFAFVYDEFWLASRGPNASALLAALLGPGYKQKPHVWAHVVEPSMSACGWPPHVDGRRGDLSLWIPLTDATLDNGCLYLLPEYASAPLADPMPRNDVLALLQSIRAIPAKAGSLLCWDHGVLHWGSYGSARAAGPRMSLALEFQRDDPSPELIDPQAPLPDFNRRIELIARAILKYLEAFEPGRWREEWVALAERMLRG